MLNDLLLQELLNQLDKINTRDKGFHQKYKIYKEVKKMFI